MSRSFRSLGVTDPPRLELVVRSWISLAESTALIWLDGPALPRAEPRPSSCTTSPR